LSLNDLKDCVSTLVADVRSSNHRTKYILQKIANIIAKLSRHMELVMNAVKKEE
jgi:hypothetical protein